MIFTRSDRYLHTATCMERVQVAVPTSGEHALEVWEAIRAKGKAHWRARGEWHVNPLSPEDKIEPLNQHTLGWHTDTRVVL